MAKSAMESLNRRFEEESGDTNVDIEVIVNADGEAAEDIIEASEEGESAAEDVAISQENAEATQEANDMAEMAAILRKYGLTAGMAAILNVALPMQALGIAIPALESLDASGRNQAVADRIATRLEAAVEGFWESTKKFLKSILLRIQQALNWIWQRMGGIRKRVIRAHDSIKTRTWDAEQAKDRKFPKRKEDTLKLTKTVSDLSVALGTHFDNFNKQLGQGNLFTKDDTQLMDKNFDADALKAIGLKYSDDKTSLVSDSNATKVETSDEQCTTEVLEELQGTLYNTTLQMLDNLKILGDKRDRINTYIKNIESNKELEKDKDGATQNSASTRNVAITRSYFSNFVTVLKCVNNKAKDLAMLYVRQCSALRLCTK